MKKFTVITSILSIFLLSACSTSRPTALIDREAVYQKSQVQDEIELIRKDMAHNSKWGRGETKSWNERYKDNNTDLPYLGPQDSHGLYRY